MTTIHFDDKRWGPLDPKSHLTGIVESNGLTLAATTTGGTDWWRVLDRDASNGPTLGFTRSSSDSFEVSVELELDPKVQVSQVDQLAVFLRLAPTHWIKAGIEFDNGRSWNGVVVANPYSDWSLHPRGRNDSNLFTIAYKPGELHVYLGDDMIREVKWFGLAKDDQAVESKPVSDEVFVGIMACSPKEGGAAVRFNGFQMREGVRAH